MDRTRITTDPVVVMGVREHAWDSKLHNYYDQYPTRISYFGEVMRDTVGHRYGLVGGVRRQHFNPVYHHKWDLTYPTGTIIANRGAGSAGTIWCEHDPLARAKQALGPYDLGNVIVDLGAAFAGVLIGLTPSPFEGHGDRWELIRPSLRTRAGLSVFLWELREIKRGFEIIPSRHISFRGKKAGDFVSWNDVLKYGNDAHLSFNFGWKPFVRDVKNSLNGLSSFDERLKRFVSRQNIDLTRRAGDSTSGSIVVEKTQPGAFFKVRLSVTSETTWNSTFRFEYAIPDYGPRLRARAYADTLGLHVSPANIWAVIPWSFVCDWFVDVGGFLEQYSTDWIQPTISFSQAGASVEHRCTADIDLVQLVTVAGAVFRLGSIRSEVYQRSPGFPNYTFDRDSLNADKIRLLASLLLGQIL